MEAVDRDVITTTLLTRKERRRAQVRKAQKLHRQRELNRIKSLEQDAIQLCQMISHVKAETVVFHQENVVIKAILSRIGRQSILTHSPNCRAAKISATEPHSLQWGNLGLAGQVQRSPQWPKGSTSSSSGPFGVGYDKQDNDKSHHVNPLDGHRVQNVRVCARPTGTSQAFLGLSDATSLFGNPHQFVNKTSLRTLPESLSCPRQNKFYSCIARHESPYRPYFCDQQVPNQLERRH